MDHPERYKIRARILSLIGFPFKLKTTMFAFVALSLSHEPIFNKRLRITLTTVHPAIYLVIEKVYVSSFRKIHTFNESPISTN